MDIYISGYGVISAIGNNVEETLHALVSKQSGIKKGTQPHTQRFMVGEVPFSNEELKSRYQLKTSGSRTTLLGTVAAKEAFHGHKLIPNVRTGFISGTSVGGMDVSEQEYRRFLVDGVCDLNRFSHHSSGTSTEEIAAEIGAFEFVNTISTACSSAANAIMMGARLIRKGKLDRVIVGGTDSLTSFTISGFRSLMIFDEDWCRPFDASRKGLNLGEGAGYLVLESEKSLRLTQKIPLAKLSGWSNASDAFHQTASSPEGHGAVLSMTKAMHVAGIGADEISYINAHGTATPNNDLTESVAFKTVFNGTVPPFSSTKAYTGHTLAACGGIEAVISILSMNEGVLFPNLNHTHCIEETGLLPVTQCVHNQSLKHIMSNSFGFGGNNSTLLFSKI
jgi:3-oxoacyl-[acyl-carrier-protein] synthase-1